MNKKLILAIVLIIAMTLIVVACDGLPPQIAGPGGNNNSPSGSEPSGNQDADLNYETLYAYAQELGFEGTIDDLIEACRGQNAYEIARKHHYHGTEEEWLQSLIGAAGKDGQDGVTPSIGSNGNWWIGDIDTGVRAEGKDGIDGKDGEDGVGIENVLLSDDGCLSIILTDGSRIELGNVRGEVGSAGQNGLDGKSAYEIALDNGYEGSEEDWLETLVGAAGADGQNGQDGQDGKDGITPSIGDNGNWWIGDIDTGVRAEGKDGLDYIELDDGNFYVSVGTRTRLSRLNIPESFNGQYIIGIEEEGFLASKALTEITLTPSIKWIGKNAFPSTLTKVVFNGTCKEWSEVVIEEPNDALHNAEIVFYPHQYSDWSTVVPADCVNDGSEERICSVCGEKQTRIVPALGHDYDDGTVIAAASCEGYGVIEYVCSHDSSHVYTVSVAPIGHDYVLYSHTDETCTEDGHVTYKCNNCGAEKTQTIVAHSHYYVGNVCSYCGDVVDIHEHNYVSSVVEPTCTTIGYTLYTCDCGASYRDNIIDSHGHRWDEGTVTIAPTCSTSGEKTYSCSVCGETYSVSIAASHNWSETVVIDKTCTEDGKVIKKCADCGIEEVVVIPASHEWNTSEVVQQPSCSQPGYSEDVCSVCGETERHEIKPTGHTYVDGTCSKCGEKFIDNVTEDTEHPEYGMYFLLDDVVSNYGPRVINEYGVLLYVNSDAVLDKVGVYLTQDGTMWRRTIACTGSNIEYAVYVPYLAYYDEILYTGLNSSWINTFSLRKGSDGIWRYSEYATIGVNLEDNHGNMLLSLYDIGQAGNRTRIFDNLDEMKLWLKGYTPSHTHTVVIDAAVDATCTATGLTEGSHCSDCGEIITPQYVTPALGHNANHEATCTEDSVCTRCGEILAKGGHNYVDDVCTICGIHDLTHDVLIIEKQDDDYVVTGVKNKNFREVTIPDFVTIIGKEAFENCNKLIRITIPDSVKSISRQAFSDCRGLTSVTIGNSVTSIGDYAFDGCSGLTSITIPDSVTSIGIGVFLGCSGLENIIVSEGNSVYHSKGNCLIDTASGTLIQGCKNSIIPTDGSVTSIGGYAFDGCSSLTNVTIPDNITSIGHNAFSDCSGLTSITIPNSVTSIGSYAFRGCNGLESIIVAEGNSVYHSEGNCLIETVSKTLIQGCKNSIIPTDGSVTSICSDAFYYCSGLTSITIPDSVTSIGNYAFNGCSGLTSITIPDSVTSIGYGAFKNCSGLTSITVSEDNPNYSSQDGILYNKDKTEFIHIPADIQGSVIIPDGITSIGNYAFANCSGLTSITIPDTVTSIGSSAFYGCSGLTSITIPDTVTSIGDFAFNGCSGLTSITIPDSVTSIGYGAFKNCSGLTSVTIGNGVTCIDNYAFSGCSGLTSITIPDSVTNIRYGAFQGCYKLVEVYNLSSLDIKAGNTDNGDVGYYALDVYTSLDTPSKLSTTSDEYIIRTDGDKKRLVSYIGNENELTIPSDITSINEYALYNKKIVSIVIPENVRSIDGAAFSGCSGLESIIVAEGNGVYHSDGNCLIDTASGTLKAGCKNSIIPTDGSVTCIGSYAFSDCSGLTSITIPDSVTNIRYGAFSGCSGLTSITIPDSVTSIGDHAFSDCSGLTSVTIGSGVTSIGSHAFFYCFSLTNITIPDSVTSIGNYAFSGCSGLTSINIPDSVMSIGEHVFYNTDWYNNQPDGLVYAGKVAYKYKGTMPKNTSITLKDDTLVINDYAFYNCSGLTSITISDSVRRIDNSAFYNCSGLKTVIIDSSTIAELSSSSSYLLSNAETVYVKEGLEVGTYITDSFTLAESSDKEGYVMYVK